MRHIVNIMLAEKIDRDDPGTRADNFIYPAAVENALDSLVFSHDDFAFLLNCLLISTHADYQMDVFEHLLGLLQDARMPEVEQIEHALWLKRGYRRSRCGLAF